MQRGKPLIKTFKPRAMVHVASQKRNDELINWTGNRVL